MSLLASFQVKQGDTTRKGKVILSLSDVPEITILGPLNHPVARAHWDGQAWVLDDSPDETIDSAWQIAPESLPGIVNGMTPPSGCVPAAGPGTRLECKDGWTITLQGRNPVTTIIAMRPSSSTSLLIQIMKIREIP
ncbi:MAG TPA: hypothetical protein PK014_10555 [Thermoanaerobaculia bacterium]|nr:hypothetical protein [Thermoanaerobaculia bacterium]HUM30561.1 hypothetical protein [Thermoanaerobaculia bacterium]HXK68753.1 hypothetical protein [Thermoanaerobaculia bacterium]